jgi:prolipoprotein diacylglyceryltransferase
MGQVLSIALVIIGIAFSFKDRLTARREYIHKSSHKVQPL